jgi:hypothetical protein
VFISPSAAEPINIPDAIQREIRTQMQQLDSYASSAFFDKAQKNIFMLMQTDSWKRYTTTGNFFEKFKARLNVEAMSEVRKNSLYSSNSY